MRDELSAKIIDLIIKALQNIKPHQTFELKGLISDWNVGSVAIETDWLVAHGYAIRAFPQQQQYMFVLALTDRGRMLRKYKSIRITKLIETSKDLLPYVAIVASVISTAIAIRACK